MDSAQPKILVTGGSGLLGSHLLAQLCLDGKTVRAIHRKNSDLQSIKKIFYYYTSNVDELFGKIHWVQADINDIPALESCFNGIEQVYHCAALVSFNESDFDKLYKINVEGTANVVNLSLANKVKKLCYVSSIATMSKNENTQVIDEENQWNAEKETNPYALTKYGAEMEVWRANQEGLSVIVVNPGVILGSGFWHKGSSSFFSKIKKGFPFYTNGITGFIGVKDVVKTMITLTESNISNEKFVLVSENLSYKQLFQNIADAFQVKRPNIKISKTWGELIGQLLRAITFISGKKSIISLQTLRSAQSISYYQSNKVKKILGVEFEKIDEVINKIVKDYQKDNT